MLKRAYDKFRSLTWYIRASATYRRPSCAIAFGESLGDNLLCTAVARELRRRGVERIWMFSNHPDLFLNNLDISGVYPYEHRYMRLAQLFRVRVIKALYWKGDARLDKKQPLDRHVISCMCCAAGITGDITLRPYLELTPAEIQRFNAPTWQIAIQSSAGSARYPFANKEWFVDRFQRVVDSLGKHFAFVQIGSASDPRLTGALDLRGATTLRETAAVLRASRVFVGLEGFNAHLARAVDCRSVVVLGGRTLPSHFCYSCNENIRGDTACSPCWQSNVCEFERECMRRISVNDVVEAVSRQLERFGSPLAEDKDFLIEAEQGCAAAYKRTMTRNSEFQRLGI